MSSEGKVLEGTATTEVANSQDQETPRPFTVLGVSGAKFQGLERIQAHRNLQAVIMSSDEVTALCPVTGQPDFYTVTVKFNPQRYAIESKSLKLYLQSIRESGEFCEDMASRMAQDIADVVEVPVQVVVLQKPRGGVSIEAVGGAFPLPKGIREGLDELEAKARAGEITPDNFKDTLGEIFREAGVAYVDEDCAPKDLGLDSTGLSHE